MASSKTIAKQKKALIAKLLESQSIAIQKAFNQSVAGITSNPLLSQIIKALEANDVYKAIDVMGITPSAFTGLMDAVEDTYKKGGAAAIEELGTLKGPDGARFVFRFNVRDVEAEAYLKQKSSQMVTAIVTEQRENIRKHLEDGLSKGNNPKTTALNVVGRINPITGKREGGVVGLSTQYETYVRNARNELTTGEYSNYLLRERRNKKFDGLIRKSQKSGVPLTAEQIDKAVTAYASSLLKLRGITISRTETLTALHKAQYDALQQLVKTGKVKEESIIRIWDATGDKRTRMSHAIADGQQVGLNEKFTMYNGIKLLYPGDPSAPGKEIINCRCIARTKIDYLAKAVGAFPRKPMFRAAEVPPVGTQMPRSLDRTPDPFKDVTFNSVYGGDAPIYGSKVSPSNKFISPLGYALPKDTPNQLLNPQYVSTSHYSLGNVAEVDIHQVKSQYGMILGNSLKPLEADYTPINVAKINNILFAMPVDTSKAVSAYVQGLSQVKVNILDFDNHPTLKAMWKTSKKEPSTPYVPPKPYTPPPPPTPHIAKELIAPQPSGSGIATVTPKPAPAVMPSAKPQAPLSPEELKKWQNEQKAIRARNRRAARNGTPVSPQELLDALGTKVQLPRVLSQKELQAHAEKLADWAVLHKEPLLPWKPIEAYRVARKGDPAVDAFIRASAEKISRSGKISYIRNYTGNSYAEVNRSLRKGLAEPGTNAEKYRKAFDEVSIDVPDGLVLYRGLDLNARAEDLVGKIIQDASIQSTSYGDSAAFTRSTILRLKIEKGVKGIAVESVGRFGAGEREIVLAPNVRYQIDKVIETGTRKILEITVLPH